MTRVQVHKVAFGMKEKKNSSMSWESLLSLHIKNPWQKTNKLPSLSLGSSESN